MIDQRLYQTLCHTLARAMAQACTGKGRERHALDGQAFEDQDIVRIGESLGSNHFELGQAIKKLRESARLSPERAAIEILGAINYAAAALIVLERAPRYTLGIDLAVGAESVVTMTTCRRCGTHWQGALPKDHRCAPLTPEQVREGMAGIVANLEKSGG